MSQRDDDLREEEERSGVTGWRAAVALWNLRQCDATWRRMQHNEDEPCVWPGSVLRWLQEQYPALAAGVTEEMVAQVLRDVGFPIDEQGKEDNS